MTTKTPLVSIISVNYNQPEVTGELLDSLKSNSYKNLEIIVVDNGSVEFPISWETRYADVNFILAGKNLGFAGGNNLGIERAKGDFLFFLNNDTELSSNCIEKLLLTFENNPEIGVACPKIRYYEDQDRIQYAGMTAINPVTGRNKGIGNKELDSGQHDKEMPTAYAHGAAMMVKKEVIEKVGGMPVCYFLYYEELDWCEQIKKAGYGIYYQPKALVYHKDSVSVGKASTLKTYYHTRNRILFMRRNFKGFHLFLFSLFFCLFVVPKFLMQNIMYWDFSHISAFLRGVKWNVVDFTKGHRTQLKVGL